MTSLTDRDSSQRPANHALRHIFCMRHNAGRQERRHWLHLAPEYPGVFVLECKQCIERRPYKQLSTQRGKFILAFTSFVSIKSNSHKTECNNLAHLGITLEWGQLEIHHHLDLLKYITVQTATFVRLIKDTWRLMYIPGLYFLLNKHPGISISLESLALKTSEKR